MKIRKRTWYGVAFAAFILFLYVMGTYDLFMMLSHHPAYYESKGYGRVVTEYFTSYPIWMLVFWIVNLVCGLAAPVLYVLQNRCAFWTAGISFLSDLILMILGLVFRNRFEVLGVNIFCFDLFILTITFFFALYLHTGKNR